MLQTEKKVSELRSQFQHYDLYKKLITIYDIKFLWKINYLQYEISCQF
jgi:hypothetical protein